MEITLPNKRVVYLGPKERFFENPGKFSYVISAFNPIEESRYGSRFQNVDRLLVPIFDRGDAVSVLTEKTEEIVDFLNAALEDFSQKTLVHCNQGKSRSPTIVILYLINQFEMTPFEAEVYLQRQYLYRLCGWARDYIDSL